MTNHHNDTKKVEENRKLSKLLFTIKYLDDIKGSKPCINWIKAIKSLK